MKVVAPLHHVLLPASRSKETMNVFQESIHDHMAEEHAYTLSMGRSHHREALETFEMGGGGHVEESAIKGSMTWFEWLGLKYFKYSNMLTEKMAKNVCFNWIASRFGQDPGRLALGIAEGYLLYKATYPIHVSLQLYGLVKYVQVFLPQPL